MPELTVAGRRIRAAEGTSVLSALQNAGIFTLRRSLSGETRGALCGMGSCFECRARVDGQIVRTCLLPVQDGMQIELLLTCRAVKRVAEPEILVIGAGPAGLSAALAAAQGGASVTLLDAAAGPGRSTLARGPAGRVAVPLRSGWTRWPPSRE